MSTPTEDSFQITLPSNASLRLFPQNRANSFKTQLVRELNLSARGEWEVALVDIQFSQNWPNVLEKTSLALIYEQDREDNTAAKPISLHAWLEARPNESVSSMETSQPEGNTIEAGNLDSIKIKSRPRKLMLSRPLSPNETKIKKRAIGEFSSATPLGSAAAVVSEEGQVADLLSMRVTDSQVKDTFMEDLIFALRCDPYFAERNIRFLIKIEIPSGHYHSIQELGEMICKRFAQEAQKDQRGYVDEKQWRVQIDFNYDPITGIACFLPNQSTGRVHFACTDQYLMENLFAFPPTHTSNVALEVRQQSFRSYELPLTSKNACSLEYLSSMFVYSNLGKWQMVGDTEAPLLGIVPIINGRQKKRQPGDQEYYAFNPPYYIPVTIDTLREIEIELKTDWGGYFPFAVGVESRVIARLHFRRKGANSLGAGIYL